MKEHTMAAVVSGKLYTGIIAKAAMRHISLMSVSVPDEP